MVWHGVVWYGTASVNPELWHDVCTLRILSDPKKRDGCVWRRVWRGVIWSWYGMVLYVVDVVRRRRGEGAALVCQWYGVVWCAVVR